MNKSSIDWTELSWNPTTGCTKCSSGCKNCYAAPLAARLQRMGNPRYLDGFKLRLHEDKLDEPLGIKKPAKIFVNSMSDLLHEDVPDDFIIKAFDVMRRASWHEFHILTKRSSRWGDIADLIGDCPRNVFPGVSIEDRRHLSRFKGLSEIGDEQTIRMVSFEPLLEDLGEPELIARELKQAGIGWVISGGESGWSARPAKIDWFRHIRDACQLVSIPFFHKQHGGRGVTHRAKKAGSDAIIDGVVHQAYPSIIVSTTASKPQAQISLF